MRLFINEEKHQYYDEEGTIYTSVTTLIGKYSRGFNSNSVAGYCAKIGADSDHPKYWKYAGKTKKEILAKWDELRIKGCNRGNEIHNELEQTIKECTGFFEQAIGLLPEELVTVNQVMNGDYTGHLDIEKFMSSDVAIKYPKFATVVYMLHNEGYQFFAEVATFDINEGVAGLIDLFAVKDDNFYIIDYKSNLNPIDKEAGYWEKDFEGNIIGGFTRVGNRFIQPLNMLEDSTFNKYRLQLSTYRYLVMTTTEVSDGKMILIHITDKDNLVAIDELNEYIPIMLRYKELELKPVISINPTTKEYYD